MTVELTKADGTSILCGKNGEIDTSCFIKQLNKVIESGSRLETAWRTWDKLNCSFTFKITCLEKKI